jgi:broad specificity phosphatase PhoE
MIGTSVRIFLTRHGETEWNVEGRWQGQSNSRLTQRGVEQARKLAEALADEPLAAVYSSDLGRALETARYVAAPHGLEPIPDRRLREMDTGLWTARLGAEIRAECPAEMETWKLRPWAHRMPRGETLAEVQRRGLAFFEDRVPRYPGEAIAVISHGAVTQTVLAHAMRRPLTDLWLGRFENCQISRLEWTPAAGLKLVELCDVRHLEGVGALKGWRTVDADAAEGEMSGPARPRRWALGPVDTGVAEGLG